MRNLSNGAAFDDFSGSRAMPTGNCLSSLESRAASCDRTCLVYTKLPRPGNGACHYLGRLLHSCCQILCLSICLDLSCLGKALPVRVGQGTPAQQSRSFSACNKDTATQRVSQPFLHVLTRSLTGLNDHERSCFWAQWQQIIAYLAKTRS